MKPDYKNFIEKLTQKGKTNYFVIVGIIGIFLIVISDFSFEKTNYENSSSYQLQNYKNQMEKEITSLLKEIDGVGEVKVMISLESGEEHVYVQQEKSTQNIQNNQNDNTNINNSQTTFENEVVIIDNSGADTALVEKTLQPAVQGVAVVCSGADDISVVTAVTNSVSVVLNVPTHKICVTKMR